MSETKHCIQCGISFEITDKEREFYDKISPSFQNKRYLFPSPELCPNCRIPQRLIRRNERTLYKRKCDFSGETIISNIAPEKPYKVYKQNIWLGDKWDPMDYRKDFDFTKSFFEQINELIINVPLGVLNFTSENCDYVSYGTNNKDCYLSYCISYSNNCYYSKFVQKSEDCRDCLVVIESRNCFECIDITNCFDLKYCFKCHSCSRSTLLVDCEGCNDCFTCYNQRNKQYCILNKQYTKEEYQNIINTMDEKKYNEYKQIFDKEIQTRIVKNLNITNCENCSGDVLSNCKDCINCTDGFDAEDCKDTNDFGYGEGIYSCSYVGYEVKYAYETLAAEQVYNCAFCTSGVGMQYLYYCLSCTNCSNCFGCVGLRNKEYCIFNKQYTKEEYETLVPKIIEHMQKTGERGKFFPIHMSPFAYNEAITQEYYPLSREEAIEKGYTWQDKEYPINIPENAEKIDGKDLSKNIKEIGDDITNKVIICEITGKPFRIIKSELEFYRKYNLPLPTKHPDQRHKERMKRKNPKKLWDRKCVKCGKDIQTSYAPERPEKVYCEVCYNKEIYG